MLLFHVRVEKTRHKSLNIPNKELPNTIPTIYISSTRYSYHPRRLRNGSSKRKKTVHVISFTDNRYSAITAFLCGMQEPENPTHIGSHALSPGWPTEPVWCCGENESLSFPGMLSSWFVFTGSTCLLACLRGWIDSCAIGILV